MSELTTNLLGPAVGDVILGRYRIERLLGSGPFATVYKAADLELKSALVAIKRIHHHIITSEKVKIALRSRVLDMRQLSHASVVRTFDLEESQDKEFYIITEFCEGWNLSQLLDERSGHALKTNTAIYILGQLLNALSYAHSKGVLHTNLKPQNILISREGEVKLCDFSLNLAFEQSDGFTSTGEGIANPSYMAPEQFTLGDLSPQTDLYSWGVLGYQLLCGSRAMPAKDYLSCARTHISGELPTLFSKLEIPEWLETLLAKCCAVDPKERPTSAKEIHEEVVGWQQNNSYDTKQLQQSLTPRQLRSQLTRWKLGVLIFGAVTLLTFGLTISQPRPRQALSVLYLSIEEALGADLQFIKKPLGINYKLNNLPDVIRAIKAKDEFASQFLIRHAKDDGTRDETGTPASLLLNEHNIGLYLTSLDHFVKIDATDSNGNTILHKYIADPSRYDFIERLINRGASVFTLNQSGFSPVHLAVFTEDPTTIRRILAVPNAAHSRTELGRTPIMVALQEFTTESNLMRTLKILIEHGAQVTAVDNYGVSTLEYVRGTKLPTVIALIEAQHRIETERPLYGAKN